MYPTAGLHVSALHEKDYATALTRAYNDWLYRVLQNRSGS